MPKNPDENFEIPGFDSNEDPFGGESQDFFDPSPPASAPPSAPTMPPPVGGMPQAPLPRQGPAAVDRKVVNLTSDIPVQIVAVLGKKSVTVKDIVSLRMGEVVELNRLPNEAIDLVANGKLIAKGELVDIDGRLGLRILKIFD
jgi:flagellar motor switch protein FliN